MPAALDVSDTLGMDIIKIARQERLLAKTGSEMLTEGL